MIPLDPYEEAFLIESNNIEGITRNVYQREKLAFSNFLLTRKLQVQDLITLVDVFQPGARLRDMKGLNVRVGNHFPIPGGPGVLEKLQDLIDKINNDKLTAYNAHHEYETLHPFTDGNGRSGRMLWWKMMGGSRIGFLHRWYYQSLDYRR